MIIITRITKEESLIIRKAFPRASIAITNRQSSHKGYYVEENTGVMRLLNRLRSADVIEKHE